MPTRCRRAALLVTVLALLLALFAFPAFAEEAREPGSLIEEFGVPRFQCCSAPIDLFWPTGGSGPIARMHDHHLAQWEPQSGARLWKSLRVLPEGAVYAFSPDGQRMAWLQGGNFTVAPLPKGEVVVFEEEKPAGSGPAAMIAISGNGGRIAVAYDNALVVWDAKTGRMEISRQFDDFSVPRGLVFSPNGESVLMERDNHPLARFSASDETAAPEDLAAASASGRLSLLTATTAARVQDDGSLDVFDLESGKSARLAVGAEVEAAAVSRDGNFFATAHASGELKLWNARTGDLLKEFKGPWDVLNRLAISPDGKRIAASTPWCGAVFVIEIETGRCDPGVFEESEPIVRLAVSRDGRFLATLSGKNTVCLWDLSRKRRIWKTPAVGEGTGDLVFWPDGSRVLLALGARLEILDSGTGKSVKHLTEEHGPVSFSGDGRRLARSLEGGFGICMADSLMEDGVVPSDCESSLAIEFALDQHSLYSVEAKKVDRDHPEGWQLSLRATSREVADSSPLPLPGDILAAAFSPDRRLLALRMIDSTRVIDTRSALPVFDLKEPTKWMDLMHERSSGQGIPYKDRVFLAWSPDGKSLFSTRSPRKLGVVDVASGERVLTIDGPAGPFALIPGTTTLVMGGMAGQIQFRDATIPVRPPVIPADPVLEIAWRHLGVTTGRVARRAASAIVRSGKAASAFLEAKMKIQEAPAAAVDPLIARLRDDKVETRAAAEAALRALGSRAEPALGRALAVEKDPEARVRIDAVLHPLLEPTARTAGKRRFDWAIRILEEMGARDVLARIADGSFPGRTRAVASAALERLKRAK